MRPSHLLSAAGLVVLASLMAVGGGAGASSARTPKTGSAMALATRVEAGNQDPFAAPAIADFLESRSDQITVGLYDVATKQTYLYNPGVKELTASMVKIDILADLLYQSQEAHRTPSAASLATATKMIEDSDNTAAQGLWVQIGQLPALSSFNQLMGFDQTSVNWGWGLEATTPSDQLRLLENLTVTSRVLSAWSRNYEMNLMQHVVPWERFGIPSGVPSTASVGVKDGWYPEATGWQINSAGFVRASNCSYLAVVMTAKNPDESYGIDTVNTVGRLLWDFESTHQPHPSH